MAFFYYDVRVPTDVFVPREHTTDELDALLVSPANRDSCKDNYAEFQKCIVVQHQTKSILNWKSAGRDHCGYYFDHWN